MARVRPFKAWRYASPSIDISTLTAPPYDVISPSQREAFAGANPHNVVELELPLGSEDVSSTDNRYATGARTWNEWRETGVLAQDPEPSVYAIEQRFMVDGSQVSRKAFVVAVGLEPFDAGVILPHERTLPKALGDRFELIKATGANFSQVFGLFEDAACDTDAIFHAVMQGDPVARSVDADGVESVLWRCSDEAIAQELSRSMSDKRVYIADGHHRYTTALAYRDMRREQDDAAGSAPVDPAYDWLMMALVNMDDPQLAVLPYNRIANGPAEFDPAAFKRGLELHFDLAEVGAGHPAHALDGFERPALMVRTRDDERPFIASLRKDVDLSTAITADQSDAWKSLDVAVLQELVLRPLLGIHPDDAETLDRIWFAKDPHEALAAVGEHDVAFVLRPTRLEQLRAVSNAGEIMPQKSTYFYPKLPSGMVFRSAE